MICELLSIDFNYSIIFAGIVFGFIVNLLALKKALLTLPRDQGRQYAINGELSKGKPRGGGIVFVIIYVITALLFIPFSVENLIYYALLLAAMLTGYLDDMSKIPWGELKKGLLDLLICVITVITYCNFDGEYSIRFFNDTAIALPPVLYMLIAVFFLWVSINVTNCTDGVDGLLGTLSSVTLCSLACIFFMNNDFGSMGQSLMLAAVLLAYLVYNASPSRLLMGDAGSRAIGLFLGILVLKTNIPLIYFLIAGVIFVDGGIGLVKLVVLRVLKAKNFLKNIRTPLHDHARKNKEWSDTHVVTRFAIIQIMLCAVGVYIAKLIIG